MFNIKTVLFLAIINVVSNLSCGNGGGSNEGANGSAADLPNRIPVQTHVIQQGEVVDLVRATGTIFPLHDVTISSQTAGTVIEVYVEVGARVEKGTPLVQIDPELKQLALEQAEANLMQAKAAFDKATKDFERNEKLHMTNDISQYIFESARLQKKSAEATYLTANANVKIAKRQLKDARIVSPVSGLVAARLVELGSTVAPGVPIAKVVDISQVKVKFGVAERDVVKVEKGQPATISVDSYAQFKFSGQVSSVGPQADLSTRTFPIEVLVDNPELKLKAGMISRVEIATQTNEDALLLPKSALLERASQTIIYIIKDGTARKRIPKLGIESGDYITILEGAEAGDEVVVIGQENLSEGVEVKRN